MKKNFRPLILLSLITTFLMSSFAYGSGFPTDEELKEMNPSSRKALLEYIADREALRASENPDQFNKEVKDITLMERAGAMTGEMAKFYLAVAVLEYSNCLTTGDATKCTQFMESMKMVL